MAITMKVNVTTKRMDYTGDGNLTRMELGLDDNKDGANAAATNANERPSGAGNESLSTLGSHMTTSTATTQSDRKLTSESKSSKKKRSKSPAKARRIKKMKDKAMILQWKLTKLLIIAMPLWFILSAACFVLSVTDIRAGTSSYSENHYESANHYNIGLDVTWWAGGVGPAVLFLFYAWHPIKLQDVKNKIACCA